MAEWRTVSEDDVRTVWTCPHEDCKAHGEEIMVTPGFFSDAGTPICGECGDDLIYLRVEVLK